MMARGRIFVESARRELIFAMRHDMKNWKEFNDAWPEYHQYLYWQTDKDKMIAEVDTKYENKAQEAEWK